MIKNLKKVYRIFLLMSIAILPIINAQAQSAMKIEKKTYITTGTRKEAKFYTNKGYAFCITPQREGAGEGATLNYMSKEDKGELLYLLEKTGTTDNDYLKTQLAIWILKFNYMPNYYVNNSNIDVVKNAKTLATEASKKANYTSANPTIDISVNSLKLNPTSDGKFYQSEVITLKSTGIKESAKVELKNAPVGTELKKVNSNANDNAERYEITVSSDKITKEEKFQLVVTAKGTTNTVERYSTGNNKLQDLIVLIPEEKTVSKTLDFTITPILRTCEFYNNQYYGKDGKITTQENYELQCKSHTCEKVGDKYFGKLGTIVTEETYQLECFKHTCEKIGNKYFGKDGIEVSETDYKAQCEPKQVFVPDTKASFNPLLIIVGSITIGTTLGTITYYHDKKSI